MASTVARRLARLEVLPGFGGGWRGWVGRPLDVWPDAALEGYIRATVRPAEVPQHLRGELAPGAALSDELLQHIAGQAEHHA